MIRIQISKTLSLFVNYLIYLVVGTDNTQYLISFSITQRVVARQEEYETTKNIAIKNSTTQGRFYDICQ